MEEEFDVVAYIKQVMAEQKAEDKKNALAELVPSIFVTQGDHRDMFALEANGKWSKDRYPRELLPAIRAYKTALLKELREAEYYIRYLQDEGLYPLGRINVKVTYEEKDDNDLQDTDM